MFGLPFNTSNDNDNNDSEYIFDYDVGFDDEGYEPIPRKSMSTSNGGRQLTEPVQNLSMMRIKDQLIDGMFQQDPPSANTLMFEVLKVS